MKLAPIIICFLFVLSLATFPYLLTSRFENLDTNANHRVDLGMPSSEEFSLTWTSNWDSEPKMVTNSSTLIGDHIILNSTFGDVFLGHNITRTELRILNGFTFSTSRLLQPITDSTAEQVPYEQMDWINISGIIRGDLVNITAYANNDCDYVAFDGATSIYEYYWANNLLGPQMCTGNNPERGEFIWNSDSDTMVFGCYNYDNTSEGNWSVYIEIGNFTVIKESSNTISFDTYWLDNTNDTYQITTIGYTDLNESFVYRFEDVMLCNFFAPDLTLELITITGDYQELINISWHCYDLNSNDSNYFEIWLSNDGGFSFMRLITNLTESWYLWDSAGWLEDEYIARIRAYSVDLSLQSPCTLDAPPYSYWPGDYGQILTYPFFAGDVTHGIPYPYYWLSIDSINNLSFPANSIGNNVTLRITIYNNIPSVINYHVYDNNSLLFTGICFPATWTVNLTLNFDDLSLGTHNILVQFQNEYNQSVLFTIYVFEENTSATGSTNFDWRFLLASLTMVVSAGSSIIILAATVLIIRARRGSVLES